jgi:hypothetical protein
MDDIVIKKLTDEELKKKGVFKWPIWEKEPSRFSWSYKEKESCYIIKGRVTVTFSDNGKTVFISSGDYVEFPQGRECVWEIHEGIRKHYNFG